MSAKTAFHFDNSFFRDLKGFYSDWDAEMAPNPRMIKYNSALAKGLGLPKFDINELASATVFSGSQTPDGANSLSQVYAGHQFGQFSSQLGDGRAVLWGEILTPKGERYDIALKGSGKTPFSRNGDGYAVLGSVLREYLMGEAMHALDIPTTRALAVVETGLQVQREKGHPGAVLTRVASSHIRVGTFQFFAARQEFDKVKQLADYAISRHYPEITPCENPYLNFLYAVQDRQASLIAKWMSVGFIHGVMNTDNMAISGETIDYGPCAFMDHYDPHTVFSSIDNNGRYSYKNQPIIARWNISKLAECLLPLIDTDEIKSIKKATKVIDSFSEVYEKYWLSAMQAKLGLKKNMPVDANLIDDFLHTMLDNKVDYTLAFRALINIEDGDGLRKLYKDHSAPNSWIPRYIDRLKQEVKPEYVTPIYIPRNHLVEDVLNSAEITQDYMLFERLLNVITQPYSLQKQAKYYSDPPEIYNPNYQTFCGT